MSTLSIRLRYRPLRIGWCVERGDVQAFRRSVRRSFALWGGRYNPIVVLDDEDQARRLIDLFRVDALFAASETSAVEAFVERQRHLPWPSFQDGLMIDRGGGRRTSVVADLMTPITRLFEERFKQNPQADPLLRLYEWRDDDPLADVLLTSFGGLPPVQELAEDYAGLMALHLRAERAIVQPDQPLALPAPDQMTLAALNRVYIRQHHEVQNYWNMPGLYVGDVGSFDDLVAYWNLRAADIPLFFYDPDHAERMAPLRDQWIDRLPSSQDRDGWARGPALWISESRRGEDIVSIEGLATVGHVGPTTWNGLNIKAPIMIFGEGEALASLDSETGTPRIAFPLEGSPFKDSTSLGGQHHVISVDPGIGLFRNDRFTLHLPFVPALNEFYGRNVTFQWNKVRAEPGSLGIIASGGERHITMRSVGADKLVEAMFASVGIAASASPAGLVGSRLVTQMGCLDDCRVFRIGGVRDLIEGHSPDQSFTMSAAKRIIRAEDTDHPLNDYQSLYIEQRAPGSKLTNDAVFSHLLRKEVFRPGLKFTCPNCSLDFWRSLDDVKTRAECEYCGNRFNVGPQLRDRDWAFRRTGLFGRADNQEGAIPVVLTLQQLSDVHGPTETVHTMAMSLTPNEADIATCETDFVLVSQRSRDHRIQVAIGECKTRQPIAEQDVRNLLRVANAFPEDRFDVYIVFAKLSDFSAEELEHIRGVNCAYRRRAIILSKRELEPWHVYERTAAEFEIQDSAINLNDMAEVTEAVYFEKRLRSVSGKNGD